MMGDVDEATVHRAVELGLIGAADVPRFLREPDPPKPDPDPYCDLEPAERLTACITVASSGAPAFRKVRRRVLDATGREIPPPARIKEPAP